MPEVLLLEVVKGALPTMAGGVLTDVNLVHQAQRR